MASKMLILCGSDSPENAYMPFMIGLGALASDLEVTYFFSISGLNIIKKGNAEKIILPNAAMSLPEFIQKAQELGARMVACAGCLPIAGITEEDLIEGVSTAGAATFVSEAEEADIVLTF